MINQNLHRQPVPLDNNLHRKLKLRVPIDDWSVAAKLNAMFVAAVEFADACREYPIVFVRAGTDEGGKAQIAPIAVLGLLQEQNLYLHGGRWRASYMPAVLRAYPLCIGRIDEQRFAVCLDMAWSGVGEAEGEPLFSEDGQATEMLKGMQQHFETLEGEIQRTRLVGQRLLELDLLRDMRFDATLPDGRQHSVDGFLTVDPDKLQALPDATIVELHRNGLLGLVHLHLASLGHMRRLLEWHLERSTTAPAAPMAT